MKGVLSEPSSSLPAGTPYRADDPELSLWVFSTLVWTAIEATETFFRAVPDEERDAYYRDMTRMAHLFNVPDELLPPDYAGLERYVHRQVEETLDVGRVARLVARQILHPDPPIVPRPLEPLASILAAGVLPQPVQTAYGLSWRRRERVVFAVVRRSARLVIPLLPARARYWPHYRVAGQRLDERTTPQA